MPHEVVAALVRDLARGVRPSSSSRTCTGRTRPRSTSCGCSRAESRRFPLSSSPHTATTCSTAASAPARARGASTASRCRAAAEACASVAGGGRVARRVAPHRRGRALSQDRRQPVLRHRGARRGVRGDPRLRFGTPCSPAPRVSAPRRRRCWRRSRSCRRMPSSGCWRRSREMPSALSTNAWRPGMLAPRRLVLCSATSSRASRSRSRLHRTESSNCTARRSRRSPTPRRRSPIWPGSRITPKPRATPTPSSVSRPQPRPGRRRSVRIREAAAQYARALRFGDRLGAAERAELLERRSRSLLLDRRARRGDRVDEGGARPHRGSATSLGEGGALSALAKLLWYTGPNRGGASSVRGSAWRRWNGSPPGPRSAAWRTPRLRSCR